MFKKKKSRKSGAGCKGTGGTFKEVLSLYAQLADLKREMRQASEAEERKDDRLTDIEIHVNILARLLTTLCVEQFGIRAGALKRLVRRVEKEAVRDSQIMELESLYNLSHGNLKKNPPANARSKDDPWEQIS